jgi:exoribonuclease-2
MPQTALREGSLVLYKNRPARVKRTGSKLEIELEGSATLKVRPKDVVPLHPGPIQHLGELQPQAGEVETAWEILAGEAVPLTDLAELIYGTYTPATAWAAWQLVADGLYFHGSPKEVIARLPDDVARERAARQAEAVERQARAAFMDRVRSGWFAPQDAPYLQEVEALALGQTKGSGVLRELGRAERPETAHALLLELGFWDRAVNPYPRRFRLDTAAPVVGLPELPEEARVDLTHLPAFAIDDAGNQDPDDALSLDGKRLWVHVADVAALVWPESEADLEARARGANSYLPEGTTPMLPPRVTQVLGLGLNEVSPALSFGLDLSPEGEVVEVEVVASWVRVTRLTYAEVELRLEEEPFQTLCRLAQVHQARRRDNGAISIELPEVTIKVEDGTVEIRPLPPLKSRTLVTEAMLMAGGAVARYAVDQGIPFPFSTQDPPPDGTVEQTTSLAGMYALRRALKRSQMASTPAPHAGLGMTVYAQVTSPLRRYLDLVAHQQLRAHLGAKKLLGAQEVLERVGAAEAVTGSVRQAERLSRRHWTLVYLLDHPDWTGEGVLVEKRGSRGTLLVAELDLEPRVHLPRELALDSAVPLVLTGVNLPELMAHFRVERRR